MFLPICIKLNDHIHVSLSCDDLRRVSRRHFAGPFPVEFSNLPAVTVISFGGVGMIGVELSHDFRKPLLILVASQRLVSGRS